MSVEISLNVISWNNSSDSNKLKTLFNPLFCKIKLCYLRSGAATLQNINCFNVK